MHPLITLVLALAAALLGAPRDVAPPDADPVDVFAPWDGTWRGRFVGYRPDGTELYRIAVEQTYRRVDANTQEVRIRDTMPDGTVIEGRGRNVALRGADGTLELRCTVTKSNGDRVEHEGRVVHGPDGDDQLVWSSDGDDRVETFREWVWRDAEGTRYSIHGMGRYGRDLMLMAGEYRRVER